MAVVATPALIDRLPTYLPNAVQSFPHRPISVGDVVTITIANCSRRYVVSAVDNQGRCDITAEDAP